MGRKCKDYTNQICGCWRVIERDWNPSSVSHETFWIAECQNCGNIASVRKYDLDKQPKFCNNCKGTSLRSWKIGDKYGLLTIIGQGVPQGNHTYVKVQCDCGSDPFEVRLEHLKGQCHGRTQSCGCLNESSGELKIRQYLEKQDINFQKQYRIKNKQNEIMVFDFVIFDKDNNIHICIEYNGEQHYQPIDFFGGEASFQKQQERDARKEIYCLENNIVLIWIPYWQYDEIDNILFSLFENKK